MSDLARDVGLRIVPYAPQHHDAFRRLNEAWIRRYFRLEAPDRRVLDAPQEEILDKGGRIIVALHGNDVVGVCALLSIDERTFELVKMAVADDAQRLGVGTRLGEAAIEQARAAGAARLILESNTVLAPAMALYRRLGFVEVTGIPSEYSRCNIHMERML